MINRANFDVCTLNSFGGFTYKAYLSKDRTLLYMLDDIQVSLTWRSAIKAI